MVGGINNVLKDCVVSNGVLKLKTSLTDYDMRRVSEQLYNKVVDYAIPHWRVVACTITDNGKVPDSIVGNIWGLNASYVNMMDALSNIVLSEKHGNFYQPDIEGVNSVLSNVPESEMFGHVMITDCSGVVTTSNGCIRYFGETAIPVKCMVDDLKICDVKGNNVVIYAYLAYGTGIVDFEDNNRVFRKCRNIVPCRTIYDLSKFIIVRPYQNGSGSIKIDYTANVNEEVLTDILRGVELNI